MKNKTEPYNKTQIKRLKNLGFTYHQDLDDCENFFSIKSGDGSIHLYLCERPTDGYIIISHLRFPQDGNKERTYLCNQPTFDKTIEQIEYMLSLPNYENRNN